MDQNVTPTNPPIAEPSSVPPEEAMTPNILAEVAKKISEARNVLIALSSNPSVDEMAAAIGLTLFLDRLDKRATAIYSGATPNALEFLRPEDTFEPSADALQDFVIALNKEKADHIRYKLDGEYVKIYITPYKTRIDEKDLEFAHGDYNVDLVLALDVTNGVDLDSALREHGRIMHDAVIINITTGNPGKFGEIEWSDKTASSVSEMIANLLYSARSSQKIEKDDATAFLTGIIAATNRFSNAKTTPETMRIASKLMESGANQQLIAKNITPEVENELYAVSGKKVGTERPYADPTKLDIAHEEKRPEPESADAVKQEVVSPEEVVREVVMPEAVPSGAQTEAAMPNGSDEDLLEDLKAAEASLAQAGSEAVPEKVEQPVRIDGEANTAEVESELNANPMGDVAESGMGGEATQELSQPAESVAYDASEPGLPPVAAPGMGVDVSDNGMGAEEGTIENIEPNVLQSDSVAAEKVIEPPVENAMNMGNSGIEGSSNTQETLNNVGGEAVVGGNPASMMAPQVATAPEVNGVPEMNYMPLPGQEILPPPPTPPIDMGGMPEENAMGSMEHVIPTPATTSTEPVAPIEPAPAVGTMGPSTIEPAAPAVPAEPTNLGAQPAMQDQVYRPQAADPGAFKIPGV